MSFTFGKVLNTEPVTELNVESHATENCSIQTHSLLDNIKLYAGKYFAVQVEVTRNVNKQQLWLYTVPCAHCIFYRSTKGLKSIVAKSTPNEPHIVHAASPQLINI